jgi:predicted amidohydrolase
MKSRANITLVQFHSGKPEDTIIDQMKPYFDEAKENGSDLIAFPEYTLGNRIPLSHPRVQAFMALAREYSMYAVCGLVETHDERWSTTALVVDRQGVLLGRAYKTHPASGPAPHWWPPVDGNDSEARGILGHEFPVFHLDFGTIGILQCYDGYFPEAFACTSYAGAEIVLWINGRGGMIEDAYAITGAQCYGCVVAANVSDGRNTGFAEPYHRCIEADGEREESRMFPRIREEGDACVHAEIDMNRLRWTRKHLRTQHQRRPDLYGMLTQDVKMWQSYPDIPWDRPECANMTNRAQLDAGDANADHS